MWQVCKNFLAGNMLRSASRYIALDETALFGCACRHFMYDIACTLFSLLKVSIGLLITNVSFNSYQSLGRVDILSICHFCLPTFHSYGNKASCQIYSPMLH